MVHFYHFDWSYEIFTNLTNPNTHLTLSSFKNIKEKKLNTKSCNFIFQLFFSHLITCTYLQMKYIITILVE